MSTNTPRAHRNQLLSALGKETHVVSCHAEITVAAAWLTFEYARDCNADGGAEWGCSRAPGAPQISSA